MKWNFLFSFFFFNLEGIRWKEKGAWLVAQDKEVIGLQ